MSIVLFAPLDSRVRALVQQVVDVLGPDCEPRFLGGPEELLRCLERGQGDLLFVDLDLPVAEVFLSEIARLRSAIPVVGVGTGVEPNVSGYEAHFPQCYFPLMTYLPKPLEREALVQAFLGEMRQLARGVIEGLSLPSLLQMLNIERKTCTIRVSSGRRVGFFYMQGGELINARFRNVEGLDAAVRLLAADSPRAEIQSQLHDPTRRIQGRLEEVLMEAMRFKDEDTDASHPELTFQDEAWDGTMPESETGKWHFDPGKEPATASRRKRLLLPLLAIPVLLGVAALAALPFRKVSIRLRSIPAGAALSLDDRRLGQAPLVLELRKPVRGTLRAEVEGYQPLARQLQEGDKDLELVLEPLPKAIVPVIETPPPPVAEPEAPSSEPVLRPRGKRKAVKLTPAAPTRPGKRGDVFDQLR
ncbi:MAG: response regulator [Holophagaceae bacterium]|nr:response regulator [Holophagaceae bacterium]